MNSKTIRVAIVDDDPIVRAMLARVLQAQPTIEVALVVSSGEEAVEQIPGGQVDVALMDVSMPGMGGIEATRQLRAVSPRTKVLVFTSLDQDDTVRQAMAAGAGGFILKDSQADSLVSAIHSAHDGVTVFSEGPASRLLRPAPAAAAPASDLQLSPREREILELLCNACSNADIAKALFLSESTVKTHVSNLMAKMGVTSRLQAAVAGFQLGLVTPGSE